MQRNVAQFLSGSSASYLIAHDTRKWVSVMVHVRPAYIGATGADADPFTEVSL